MRYHWDAVKNAWLMRHRKISFEEVVWAIAQGQLLDVLISEQAHHHGQKQLVVQVRGYAYLVPVVEQGEGVFLKTIIPSRKLTRRYLRKEGAENGSHRS